MAKIILNILAAYLAACGLSAILYPKLWLIVAGISAEITPLCALIFGVLGGYILALGVGSAIAARDPRGHYGLVVTLLVSQLLDLGITSYATFIAGLIPIISGAGFLVVTMTTSLAVGWVVKDVKR
jgi:hypothetical protein